MVGKPSKASISKAYTAANFAQNGPLSYADMEAIILEGMKLKNSVPEMNLW